MAQRPHTSEQRARQAAQRRLAREQRELRELNAEQRRGELRARQTPESRAFRRQLERIQAPVLSRKEINVIAQEGQQAGLTTVYGLTKSERHEVWKHWAITQAYLNYGTPFAEALPGNPYTKPWYTQKRLENMIRNYEGKMTGGANPVEFASDPSDIVRLAQVEDITFEMLYPHVTAAA